MYTSVRFYPSLMLEIRMILSVREPYLVLATDVNNSIIFGYEDHQIRGKSILSRCSADSIHSLEDGILMASNRQWHSSMLNFYDKTGNIQNYFGMTAPYLDENNMIVGCLLVLKATATEKYRGSEGDICNHTEASFLKSGPESSAVRKKFAESFAKVDECPSANPSIRPRKKRGFLQLYPDSPVTVSVETVQNLQHMPQSQAAAHIGISATALKRACRKLGIDRWPFRRLAGPVVVSAPSKQAEISPSLSSRADTSCVQQEWDQDISERLQLFPEDTNTALLDDDDDDKLDSLYAIEPLPDCPFDTEYVAGM